MNVDVHIGVDSKKIKSNRKMEFEYIIGQFLDLIKKRNVVHPMIISFGKDFIKKYKEAI